MAERSFPVFAAQGFWANLAASMALFVSASPISGTAAITSPLAGFLTSKVDPSSAFIHSPETYACVHNSEGSFNIEDRFVESNIFILPV